MPLNPRTANAHGSKHRWGIALLLLLLCIAGTPIHAEKLADADWFQRPLGEGVVWRHYWFEKLYGGPQSISYVEADLNNPNVRVKFPYVKNKRQRISGMVPEQYPQAAAAINGSYFDPPSGGQRTYFRANNVTTPPSGKSLGPWSLDSAVALDQAGAFSVIPMPAEGWDADTSHPDMIAAGPLLIGKDGSISPAVCNTIGKHCTNRHPRSAVGITRDNHLILLTADGRAKQAHGLTCEQLADLMRQLGCVIATNLDGGGSTTLWGRGEPEKGVLNYPCDNSAYDHQGERSCSNAVAVLAPAAAPLAYDARLTTVSYESVMAQGARQTVTVRYENIGTQTWQASQVKLVTARPAMRKSAFYIAGHWPSPTTPAVMTPAAVAPGQTAEFKFDVIAKAGKQTKAGNEYFQLLREGAERFGPANNAARLSITVRPDKTDAVKLEPALTVK